MIPLISMATSSSSVNFFFFFFLFLFTHSFFCFSQQNPEIQALQSFKSSIHDPLGALTSWDSTSPSAPCDWRGIFCSNDSYVSEIRLPQLQLSGFLTTQISDLRMLRKITLRSNFFNGTIPASISKCKLLDTVSFQYNSFSGQIPPEIMNLTDLETFNVAGNQMYGEIPSDLPVNLRYFDVSENLFTGGIPEKISELSQVILLNLSYNRFSGDIPASLGRLQQLQYLMLDYNELEGTVPSAISNCSSLVHLSAEGNGITGVIPAGIAALPKIKVINFSHNKLSGYLATSFFCNGSVYPPSLQIVQLSFNAFSEILHPQSSKCFSSLQILDIQHNQIHGDFPFFLTDNSALSSLDLSGNLFSGTIPSSIGNLLSLEQLRIGNNSFEGNIPVGITKCSSLSVLDLEGNRFIGEIPAFLGDLSNLKILSMGRNQFSGSIPSSFSNITSLESLNLEGNRLTGSLPEELMFLSNLSTLNLSGNKFSGSIPVVIENLQQLSVLNLSKNGFSGTIPSSIGTLYKLVVLDLSRLNLSGELPSVLGGLPSLQVIALQENNLSGNIPEGFSSLRGLQYLNLSSNSFSGHIPSTFGFLTSLVVLSLSKNHISGSVPPDLGNNTALKILNLRSNSLSGQIPSDLSRLSHLSVLDLGRNTLTGEIPEVISNCSSLTSVVLDMNHLTGNIPASLSSLSSLITLDLSGNNLSGNIPENLTVLPNLVNLNVSNNKLEGQIPVKLGSHFNDPSDYSGNQGLCGEPLKRKCERTGNGKNRLIMLIAVSASGGLLLASFCCFYIYALLRWRRKLKEKAGGEKKHSPARVSSRTSGSRGSGNNAGPKLVMFNNRITVAETIEATREFDEENVLSRTRHGVLFKACYSDGMLLSICRLPDRSLDENTFRKEAESLGRVKHRNLTVLRGYYAGPPDLRLLAYDYMPNGNLATLLQEASHQDGGHVLNWPMRHLVALGIARGLAFLHAASIIHGDVKPQNVLFDADFEAHLSDFGLDKLTVATPAEPSSSTSIGTVGYVAPEATLTGEATRQSDIYSFGIVLLELLTGKKSLMFSQDEDIVKWVKRQLQRGQISELLEPGLLELDPESSEWEEFLLGVKVGLLCTAPDPLDRPTMTDTVFMLEGCRVDQISLS